MSRAHATVSSPLPVTIQSLYRNTSPCRAPCRARCRTCRFAPTSCHRAWLRRIAAWILYIATPNDRPQPRYKFGIAGQPMARQCARTRIARSYAQAGCVAAPAGRVVGPCRTASWPYCGPLIAHPSCHVSQYNPLYRDSDLKMGSIPSSLLAALYRDTKRSPPATIQILYHDSPHG